MRGFFRVGLAQLLRVIGRLPTEPRDAPDCLRQASDNP